MREIEIKFKVKDFKTLENDLIQQGCIFSNPINQHDITYSQRNSSLDYNCAKEGDVILRIRRQDGKSEFNIKKQCSGESDNIEHETHIDDPDEMDKILRLLDWVPQVGVKKMRKKGKWDEYEICLDKVERLGEFMEIEKMVEDDSDPEIVREELFDKVKVLGLVKEDEETRGYDTQIFQLKK
jgi:adenylate cyclase class 2